MSVHAATSALCQQQHSRHCALMQARKLRPSTARRYVARYLEGICRSRSETCPSRFVIICTSPRPAVAAAQAGRRSSSGLSCSEERTTVDKGHRRLALRGSALTGCLDSGRLVHAMFFRLPRSVAKRAGQPLLRHSYCCSFQILKWSAKQDPACTLDVSLGPEEIAGRRLLRRINSATPDCLGEQADGDPQKPCYLAGTQIVHCAIP